MSDKNEFEGGFGVIQTQLHKYIVDQFNLYLKNKAYKQKSISRFFRLLYSEIELNEMRKAEIRTPSKADDHYADKLNSLSILKNNFKKYNFKNFPQNIYTKLKNTKNYSTFLNILLKEMHYTKIDEKEKISFIIPRRFLKLASNGTLTTNETVVGTYYFKRRIIQNRNQRLMDKGTPYARFKFKYIRKLTGLSDSSIKRAIDGLEAKKIIKRVPFPMANVKRFGATYTDGSLIMLKKYSSLISNLLNKTYKFSRKH